MFLSSVYEYNINYIVFCFENGVNMCEKKLKTKTKKHKKVNMKHYSKFGIMGNARNT